MLPTVVTKKEKKKKYAGLCTSLQFDRIVKANFVYRRTRTS